jgi:hypothetical protein
MKLFLAIIVLVVFGLSLLADYKWRKWMAQRRAEHQHPDRRNSMKDTNVH